MTYLFSDHGKKTTWKEWLKMGGCGVPTSNNLYKKLGPQSQWERTTTLGDIQESCIVSGRSLARFASEHLGLGEMVIVENG